MTARMTALERAFGMARSGDFDSVDRIKQALRREGYADEQIYGRLLRRQLRALIRSARNRPLQPIGVGKTPRSDA